MSNKIMSENEIMLGRLLWLFSIRGINQAKFIEVTGYSSGQASAIFNKKANLSKRLIKTVSTAFSISETWILSGEGEPLISKNNKTADTIGAEIAPKQEDDIKKPSQMYAEDLFARLSEDARREIIGIMSARLDVELNEKKRALIKQTLIDVEVGRHLSEKAKDGLND